VVRVKTILRRTSGDNTLAKTIQAGGLFINIDTHTAQLGEKMIDLTPTEFEILVTLAKQPKRVFSRMQLLESALGESFEGYDRTVDTHIKNIRMKLEPDPKKPEYIHTVFGMGYKFEAVDHA
jgi:DNA-binding response OmpR family regulator